MKKGYKKLLAAAAVFLALIAVLLLAEREAPNASIRSLSAALWYAITTLTSVGYGDLFPVTAVGRIAGAVLELGSLGVLALLLAILLTVYRSRLRPKMLLWLRRKRDWYVFLSAGAPSRAMAEALLREDPSRTIVFSLPSAEEGLPGIVTSLPAEALLRLRKSGSGVHVFALGDDWLQNEKQADALKGARCRVYCLSPHPLDSLPEGQLRFAPWEICARLYWQRFPAEGPEEEIWIVGDGRCAQALLEQALLVNVLAPEQRIRYVLFGDHADFRRCHPALEPLAVSPGSDGSGDRIVWSDKAWNADADALRAADRIIFCSDDEEENLDRLSALRRFFPVSGRVHARLSRPFDGAETFGSPQELFTPELVMREQLNRTAKMLHGIYRAANGGPAWEELSEFTRRSNLAAADHLPVKLRLLLPDETVSVPERRLCRLAADALAAANEDRRRFREIEHIRWMRFHLLYNWRYGEERSDKDRLHPLLRSFDELEERDQAKDDYAWTLIASLADLPEEEKR
ncbi:MAG: hypothetical protein IJP64_06145 [Oscillospiraceae bacterium]|nr:hypothetical protein [Oscillospiraceae bacterium]